MTSVQLHETQAAFVARVVERGDHGSSPADVLRKVLLAHVNDRLAGAQAYVGGTAEREVLQTPFPEYGEKRWEHRLEPVTGKAVPVMRGEVLRIAQTDGGTCADFNAFNLHDYKEFLDCGFTRSFQSFDPRQGEFIWTNAPRGRPMFGILHIGETNELDIVGHRCNRVFQELGWGLATHANCQDSLAEAIREYRLTPDDVHDSFNLWMATTIDETGRRQFKWNPAAPGDHIDLVAMFDVLAVVCVCGLGDLVGINNYTFTPIDLEVYAKSRATEALVDEAERRWGRMESQDTTEDIAAMPVRAERELNADPSYEPRYRAVPALHSVDVELDDEERRLLAGLIATGVYGRDEGEALRAAFMRWCNTHVTKVRRPYVEFTT